MSKTKWYLQGLHGCVSHPGGPACEGAVSIGRSYILLQHPHSRLRTPDNRRRPQMIGHGEKLSRKQDQIITALVSCASIAEAAGQCGLAEVTVRRWLKQDAFQQAYRDARQQVVQQAIVQVQQATGEAVATLRQVMQAAEAPASAKVSAAKTILETAVKAVELEDLEARIAALEAAQKGTR